MIGRTSVASRFNIDKFSEVLESSVERWIIVQGRRTLLRVKIVQDLTKF